MATTGDKINALLESLNDDKDNNELLLALLNLIVSKLFKDPKIYTVPIQILERLYKIIGNKMLTTTIKERTLLYFAVIFNNIYIAKYLLEKGSDKTIGEYETPFMQAKRLKLNEMMELLNQYGEPNEISKLIKRDIKDIEASLLEIIPIARNIRSVNLEHKIIDGFECLKIELCTETPDIIVNIRGNIKTSPEFNYILADIGDDPNVLIAYDNLEFYLIYIDTDYIITFYSNNGKVKPSYFFPIDQCVYSNRPLLRLDIVNDEFKIKSITQFNWYRNLINSIARNHPYEFERLLLACPQGVKDKAKEIEELIKDKETFLNILFI